MCQLAELPPIAYHLAVHLRDGRFLDNLLLLVRKVELLDPIGNGSVPLPLVHNTGAQRMSTRDPLVSANLDKLHSLALARLETHSCPRGNVEMFSIRELAVKEQRGIHLEEVVVRSDLDRAVAQVLDLNVVALAVGVKADLLLATHEGAGQIVLVDLRTDWELVVVGNGHEASVERELQIHAVRAHGVVDSDEEGSDVSGGEERGGGKEKEGI